MMKQVKLLAVLAAWTAATVHADAGRVLKGVVTGPDEFPIAGALVEVAATGNKTRTNGFGVYRLGQVPAGDFTLRVTADDFEPAEFQGSAEMVDFSIQLTEFKHNEASIEVVARKDDVRADIPGSVHLISKEELTISKPLDANEVLRRSPGVVIREDSGPMAMRLNIGIRGLNPDRSRKVLMLEDGIPISLAPYGEPEMYYSPPIERMSRVEILKGSGQIAHGPQTVGGVVNFVTPDPPSKFHGDFDLEGGQHGLFIGNGSLGGSNRDQSIGWVTNYLHKQGDGWRDFYFDIEDFQTKFILKPNDRHTVAVKGAVYDEISNSTYLGLTQAMFKADPNQNAVSSDTLDVERRSASLSHAYVVNPKMVWNSSVFAYTTKRFWGRQDFDRSDRGRDYLGVFGDPSVLGGAVFLRDSAGNRNREFNVFGAQSGARVEHDYGILDFGIRYVYEKARDQRVNGDSFTARTGTIRDDENRTGRAFSAYLQNRFQIGSRVMLTPGLRLESYNQQRHIVRTRVGGVPTNVDRLQGNDITTAIPGLGFSVRAANDVTLFAGVHRGFAPPRTKIAINSSGENLQLDAELSWNYEAGIRLGGQRALRGEFSYFRLDFSNQIITAAESGGATTTLVNGGAALHEGLENTLRVNWNEFADLGKWSLYTELRHMYLGTAQFRENELFGGNRLPYAPKNTFGFIMGLRRPNDGPGIQLDFNSIGDQFGDSRETIAPTADGTIGLLPAYNVTNLMVDYRIHRERWEFRPYFTVKNLFDRLYVASRAPQGIQPGMFRQVNVGVKIGF